MLNGKVVLAIVIAIVIVLALSKDYPHPDDYTRQTFDTSGLKPFAKFCLCLSRYLCEEFFCVFVFISILPVIVTMK